MSTDIGSVTSTINQALSRANTEFENTWEATIALTELMNASSEAKFAARRLISYNPQSKKLATMPDIQSAVSVISQIIQENAKSVQSNPESIESWIILGHCYLMLNDFPNAYTSYTHVMRISDSVNDAYFWYGIGCVYQHFKYNMDAAKFLKHVLSCDPQFPEKDDLNFRVALLNRSRGKYDEALALFNSLIYNPPRDLIEDDIKFHIAFTHQLAGHDDQAIHFYSDLYSRHPANLELIQQFAWYLSLQTDNRSFTLAERIIHSVPQQYSNDPMLRLVTARIAMKQQDMTTAYQRYCECISYWSDSPLFWCGLGVLYFKNDQMQDAVVAFQRALYLRSELVEAWANLGLIFEMQNDFPNALKIYQAALQNCAGSQLLKDRINALSAQGNRMNKVSQNQVIEINDSRFFTQVAEKVSTQRIAEPPIFPSNCFKGVTDPIIEKALNELSTRHKSIFVQ